MHTFLIQATQLILALAFLIIIHEFGHFLFARIFKTRVEKFYMFFDPVTEIFKWKPGKYIGFFGSHHWLKGASEEDKKEYYRQKEQQRRDEEAAKYEKECKKARKKGLPIPPRPASLDVKPETEDTANETECVEVLEAAPKENTSGKKKKKSSFWGETEYGIGWIPLGGYCRISGMIDESMDTEAMKKPARKWEFRSKPAWQRLLIMIGGVLFNFLLAILIYAGIVYTTGEKYVPFSRAELGMAYSPEAHKVGFRDGDIPISADGKALDYPADALMEIMTAKSVQVVRNNDSIPALKDTINIAIPEKFVFALEEEAKKGETPISFMTYRIPTRITQVMKGEGGDKAGIESGDEIIAIDGVKTPSLFEFQEQLAKLAENYKKQHHTGHADLTLTVVRYQKDKEGNLLTSAPADTLQLPVALSEGNKIGVGLETDITKFYPAEEKHYSIFASIPRGAQMGVDKLTAYAKSMKLVATKEGAKSIGGFGALGSIFPERWDWIAFWNVAAFLSVALAFMNILPIPALDGGHVLFLLYEIIFRRKPSEKFLERAQIIGMTFLILLLLYANGMDIVRLFR